MQSLSTRKDGWVPPVVRNVASDGRGIAEALSAVRSFLERGGGKDRAVENWSIRLREMLRERLLEGFADLNFQAAAQEIVAPRTDPYTIAAARVKRNAN